MAKARDLGRRLREASAEELSRLIGEHLEDLEVPAAAQALRNPYVSRRVIELLVGQRRLLRSYEVRRELARHPRTPEVQSLRLVSGLFWRDLVELGRDSRVPPRVRRAADRRLGERLPALSLGERVAIGRLGGGGVLSRLLHDPHPRVVAAVLENQRLTEGLLAPLVNSDAARPEVLRAIANDRRWGVRRAIRLGLARNPRTPVPTALGLLPLIAKRDLVEIAADGRLSWEVRKRARVLSGAEGAAASPESR